MKSPSLVFNLDLGAPAIWSAEPRFVGIGPIMATVDIPKMTVDFSMRIILRASPGLPPIGDERT